MTSVFAEREAAIFTTYEATIHVPYKIVGGSPKDPKLVEAWLRKHLGTKSDEEIQARMVQHLIEMGVELSKDATPAELEEAFANTAEEIKTQGFKRSPEGRICIEGRHLKAALKESMNIVYPQGEYKFGQYKNKKGQDTAGKNGKSYLAERVFVGPEMIEIADEISGVDLAIGHIKGWRDDDVRSTIGYFEYVEGCSFDFTVQVLDDCITEAQWSRIWIHGQQNGIGAMRSQGFGRYEVTRWEVA